MATYNPGVLRHRSGVHGLQKLDDLCEAKVQPTRRHTNRIIDTRSGVHVLQKLDNLREQ